MARLEEFDNYIREKIEEEQWTHAERSNFLHTRYSGQRGFSIHTIELFCSKKSIHKISKLNDVDMDECTSESIAKVNYVSAVANTDMVLAMKSTDLALQEYHLGTGNYV